MEELTQVKKKGNPNFGKKKVEVNEIDKSYTFVLTDTYEKYKPKDPDTGQSPYDPFPPFYKLASEGIAIDEDTQRSRRWRCLKGIDSIWVDDQDGIEPRYDEYEDLVFIYGKMTVKGWERNKLAALMNQDGFEGKKYRKQNAKTVYRLVDEEKDLDNALDSFEIEFEALKIAKECSDEEMLPFAFVLGINTQKSEKEVRREFIMKAKANPRYFLKHFVDPKNEISYLVHKGMAENIISTSAVEGKLVWAESRKVIMDAPKGSDIAQDIAKLVMQNNEDAVKLVEQLKRM
jgi:hypothetical protein